MDHAQQRQRQDVVGAREDRHARGRGTAQLDPPLRRPAAADAQPEPPPNRTPLTTRLSSDEGRTWGEPLTVAEGNVNAGVAGAWDRQVAYPSATELADGTVGIVWTAITLAPDIQAGVIHFAKVKVK